jgi:hypothetical protein
MEKRLLSNLIIFVVLIICGLIGWLVITNLVIAPAGQKSADVQKVLKPATINTELAVESLQLMENRQDLSAETLTDFPIFIEDSTVQNRQPDVMQIAIAARIVPLDSEYNNIQMMLASASATVNAATDYSAVAAGEVL